MMSRKEARKEAESPLVAAARALDAELRDFERASRSLANAPLDTQRHIERAGRVLREVADSEDRLGARLGELVAAIAAAREAREAHVEAVRLRARVIEKRTLELQALLQRYGGLGERATRLNAHLMEGAGGGAAMLAEVDAELGGLVDDAEALFATARDADFPDVARLADSLRQQLRTVRGKLRKLQPDAEPN